MKQVNFKNKCSFQQMVLEQLDIHITKMNLDTDPNTLHKVRS